MKLTEANQADNRAFHELPVTQRTEYLISACDEVFSQGTREKGPFTPPDTSFSVRSGALSFDERRILTDAAGKLNFLMTRLAILDPIAFEPKIRALALQRFEYLLVIGDTKLTQDPQLVFDFFTRRDTPELIRPTFERMGSEAVKYRFLAEKIIDHPLFESVLGAEAQRFKFRSELHLLLKEEHYSRAQAASALHERGFDLIQCDFNRWYRHETDFLVELGKTPYEVSDDETQWLKAFVATQSGNAPIMESAVVEHPLSSLDHAEQGEPDEPHATNDDLLTTIKALDTELTQELSKSKSAHWIKTLPALTSDYAQLQLNPEDMVQMRMWNNLWCGSFARLADQLKGANPNGRTRNGLTYNRWALTHEEHRRNIPRILGQNSYAMILAGDILVEDLKSAKANLHAPELQEFRNEEKVKAAINLAWEVMHHRGQSDDPDEEYTPPASYLLEVATEFSPYLRKTPSAAAYLNLCAESPRLPLTKREEQILQQIVNFEVIESIYTRLGMAAQIKERFVQVFDAVFSRCTEFMSIRSDIAGIVSLLQQPTFRKHVDDAAITEHMTAAVDELLQKKRARDPETDASGSRKLVLTLYQNSIVRPFLEGRINIRSMLDGMIDDIVRENEPLLSKQYSLRNNCEIELMPTESIEAYMIADRLREYVDPLRMGRLVAYLLTIQSDARASSFHLDSLLINLAESKLDPHYEAPPYLVEAESSEDPKLAFLSAVYEREKILGGLDWEAASTGVTNAIFRGTYVSPGRFFPELDEVLRFLKAPIAELLPTKGLGHAAVHEFKILNEFLAN